jgi:hypothetical protein
LDRDAVRQAVRKSFAAKDASSAQDSTDAKPSITSGEKRSQALVRAIGTVRRLLHAGPTSALSVDASAELHDLAQELRQQFP